MRIDPRLVAGRESGHWDADVGSHCGTCNFNGEGQRQGDVYVNRIGYYAGVQYIPYLSYDMNSIIGPGRQVTHADWVGHFYSADRYPNQFAVYPVAQGWQDFSLTWNNRPNHLPDTILASTSTSNQWVTLNMTSWVQNWVTGVWSNQGITIDTQGNPGWGYFRLAAMETWPSNTDSAIFVYYNNHPPVSTPTAPAQDAQVTTTTPNITSTAVSDVDGQAVSYWYRLSSTDNPEVGQIINSGWLSSPNWTVQWGRFMMASPTRVPLTSVSETPLVIA